ncbi:MAG: hypothetical protein K2I10_00805 [Lachnospiraceae bacterium]|nr:hypothetical protein [Lachnospiraceae bacterium]
MKRKGIMTKKDFKESVVCGLGRAVMHLQQTGNKEKYRDIVLWACRKNISYDVQCEGTRGVYVYDLICCYEDRQPFLDAVIDKFESCRRDSWDFNHYCALLGCFADDGSEQAWDVLWKRYCVMKRELLYKRKMDNRLLERFEILAITICTGEPEVAVRVMKNIASLMELNHLYEWADFYWLNTNIEDTLGKGRYKREIKNLGKKGEGAGAMLYQSCYEERKESRKHIVRNDNMLSYGQLMDLFRNRDEETVLFSFRAYKYLQKMNKLLQFANDTVLEKDEGIKARMLEVFSRTRWPLEPDILIGYVKNGGGALQERALGALARIQNAIVREYALKLIGEGSFLDYAVCMLAANYRNGDEDILLHILQRIPVDEHSGNKWHYVYSSVFDIYEKGRVKKAPKRVLYYLYEHTHCGMCRELYVREMMRRHILTPEIKAECRWDSNDGVRELVMRG